MEKELLLFPSGNHSLPDSARVYVSYQMGKNIQPYHYFFFVPRLSIADGTGVILETPGCKCLSPPRNQHVALGNVHVVPTTTNLPQTETEKKVIVSFSISVHLISQKSPCLSPHLGLAPSLRLYGLNGDNLKSSFIFCLPCPRIQIFPPPFSRSSNFKVKHAF